MVRVGNCSSLPAESFGIAKFISREKTKMRATGIVRNIDELGRIVIPKELRNKMDMHEGSAVEIFTEDGKICLRRFYKGCHFCGGSNSVSEFKDKLVCRACLDELKSI